MFNRKHLKTIYSAIFHKTKNTGKHHKSPITGEWVNILLYIITIIYQTAIKTIKFCCSILHAATQVCFGDSTSGGREI